MLWFAVWLVLVLATGVGAFLLGRRLARSARALAAEMERAQAVAARLEELQAELRERFPAPQPPLPDIDATPADRAAFRQVRVARVLAVRRRRTARFRRAMRHWEHVGTPL